MLYLEDYLEMIEHMPQELRDRFTEMRELDLTVQNNMDSLEKKTRNFFQQCKRGELLHDNADSEFHHLRKGYYKVMEDADEKVAIATQIHELVERYLRRLDSELFKFKCELEADNNGITEILEKRSLELDGHNSSTPASLLMSLNQKENRYYGSQSLMSGGVITANSSAGILSSAIGSGGGGVGSNSTVGIGSSSVGVGASLGISSSSSSGNAGSGIGGGSSNLTSVGIGSSVGSGACVVNTGNTIVGLSSVHTPPPRQRKLERRRETICTMTVPDKRPNLNHSLPSSHITASSSHTLTPLRPLTSSLASHPGLSTGTPGTPVTTPTTVTYNLQQLGGAASSAIAAAASQAIVATQQMQQGRRTASLKASYEAIHGGAGVGPTEFWIANATNATATAAHNPTTLPTNNATTGGHHHHHHHHDKKQKKKLNHHHTMTIASNVAISNPTGSSSATSVTSSSSSSLSADSIEILTAATGGGPAAISNVPSVTVTVGTNNATIAGINSTLGHSTTAAVNVNNISNPVATTSAVNSLPSTTVAPGANITINENGMVVEQTNEGEWSYDPNEPRYCTCNQVSYGDMVACDNDACPYEWFHYPCVGITQPPKGKWYCPKCTASMRRRGNRKN